MWHRGRFISLHFQFLLPVFISLLVCIDILSGADIMDIIQAVKQRDSQQFQRVQTIGTDRSLVSICTDRVYPISIIFPEERKKLQFLVP